MSEEQTQTNHSRTDANYGHMLKYMGVFGGVQGLRMAIGLLRNKLTVSCLGAVGVGLSAVYANIVENVNAATNFGLSFSSVRGVSELFEVGSDEQVRDYVCIVRTWCLWTALLGGLACVLLAPWIADFSFNGDRSYTLPIMCLSLMLVAMPVEAGECSVLKGMRRLKRVAMIEVLSVISTLLTTIPFYFLLGIKGVIYALVLSQVVMTAIHLCFSVTVVPYRIKPFSLDVFHKGFGLLRLGFPYAIAAVAGALTTFVIYRFIEDHGQIGLYKQGILLLSIYSSLAFTAVEVDFFPRLSAVNHDIKRMNKLVNQQIDVCILLLAPLLLGLLIVLPYIVPLLMEWSFMAVVGMLTCAIFHTFFKGLSSPVEYMALAKGQSWVFLMMELIFDVVTIVLIRVFYSDFGLNGAGAALSLTLALETIFVFILYNRLYGFVPSRKTLLYAFLQFLCLCGAVLVCFAFGSWWRELALCPILGMSIYLSIRILRTDSDQMHRILHRLKLGDECDCCK